MTITVQSRTSASAAWGTLNAITEINDRLISNKLSLDEAKAEARRLIQRWQATIYGAYPEMEFRVHDDSIAERAPEPKTKAAPVKLTKGQAAFVTAVRDGAGGIFHKRVIEPVEAMGLVHWIGGMRLIGCNAFSASRFIPA